MSLGTPTISESAPPIAQTANDTNKCSFQSVIPVGRKRKGNTIMFQKDQKTKKQASQLQKMPSNVETTLLSSLSNNRFAALAEEADRIMQVDLPESSSDEEETTPAADNGSRQSSNTVKPPAICVPNINNPHSLELALNSCAGESNYTLRTSKFGVSRIYTVNSEAFRAVVRKLTSLNCKFWHHQLKEDKPYRVVLEGMHSSVPKEQIKKAFAGLGYETLNIYCPRKGDWQNELICDGETKRLSTTRPGKTCSSLI